MKKQKLYCYVDETGQDTRGDFFLVSIIIFDADQRDELYNWLLKFEETSGKREQKWTRASHANRVAYIHGILNNPDFAGALYFSPHEDTIAYDNRVVLSITKAIEAHVASQEYSIIILIDGLQRMKKLEFARVLRKFNIKFRKIYGANDENDPLIRIADALAGFIRDARSGDLVLQKLYELALRKGIIHEV